MGSVHAIACDIRNEEQVSNLVDETLAKFKRVDFLVNNGNVKTAGSSAANADGFGPTNSFPSMGLQLAASSVHSLKTYR